jgi:HK97 family phage portal protein
MNRLQKMLAGMILGKDTTRALSLTEPKYWRDDTFSESAPSDPDAASALSLSAVWACVNLIAGTIASLPLMIYRTGSDGQRELAKDHPLYRVLHDSPNSLQTALDFWEFIEASVELWGNGYARKVKSSGRVVSLVPIMPQLPQVRSIGNGRLGYRWTEDGESYDLTSDDVLHIRGFGGNPKGGMSTLAFASRTFGIGLDLDRTARKTFQNGLRPSGVLTFDKFLTTEQRDALEQRLVEKFMGSMNSGRPMILEGGTKWEALTINPDDAQMLESRGFSVEEIARFFGVPPFMIGHTEKSTSWGTGLEQQTLGFVKFTLRRRLKRIEQALEKQLLTAEDRAAGIVLEFALEGLLRGDSNGRATFYQSGLQNGWMTINEVRQLENLPPVDGGNVPRMQSQNVPITQAPADPALPAPQE